MDKILAKVGTLTVTEKEVDEFLMELGARAQGYNTPEGRKAVLEQIISSKLLLLDARHNLLETEPEFKAELARRCTRKSHFRHLTLFEIYLRHNDI